MRYLLIALAACGGGGSSQSPDAPASGECSEQADSCTGMFVCIAGACEPAYPRVYAITDVAVATPATNNGEDWDEDGSLADIVVGISNNLGPAELTDVVPDATTATFAGPFEVTLEGEGALIIQASDDDGGLGEQIVACILASPQEQLPQLRARTIACSQGAGRTLTMRVAPTAR